MSNEVEEALKQIQSHKGVIGTMIVNSEGLPIKTTLDNTTTLQFAEVISPLADQTRSLLKDLNNTDDLTFLRIGLKKYEIMVAPDKEFLAIVVQTSRD